MKKLLGSLIIASMFIFTACEEENPEIEGFKSYNNGVFIVNEGGPGKNNGSLSFYSKDSMKMLNYVFMAENNEGVTVDSLKSTIGDVFQSMTIIKNEAYLVANNSQKITVADLNTLVATATIENLTYPRFVTAGKGDVAYISNGKFAPDSYVLVFNTTTKNVTDTIRVGIGPERMLLTGDKLYVTCLGGWDLDNRVFVIDINTNQVIKVFKTADRPIDIVADKNNDIWVLAAGLSWGTPSPARLLKIDNASMTATDSLEFAEALSGSNMLAINKAGDKLFVSDKDVIEISIDDLSKRTIIAGAGWYGLDVDPKTGYIWGFPSSFSSNGKAVVYSEEGDRLSEYSVGIAANGAVFID